MRLRLALGFTLLFVLVAQVARARLAARPPPGQRVDVGGRAVHLWCTGEGSPTVVLEAGLNDGAVQWSLVQAGLRGRVCSSDRAGLGFSDLAPHPPSLEHAVDDLHAALTAAHVEGPLVLVGHSYGALVVRAFQVRYPERVVGLLLVDPAHEVLLDEEALLSRALEDTASQFASLSWLSRLGLLALWPEAIPDRGLAGDALAQYRARLAAGPYFEAAGAETRHFTKSLAAARALPSLGDVPLVVLSRGRADPLPGLTPAEAERWEATWTRGQLTSSRLSTRSRHVVAPGAGHQLPLEAPELVIEWATRLTSSELALGR
jgi:pimeloyl-ACP methyl ester carboxylesterase